MKMKGNASYSVCVSLWVIEKQAPRWDEICKWFTGENTCDTWRKGCGIGFRLHCPSDTYEWMEGWSARASGCSEIQRKSLSKKVPVRGLLQWVEMTRHQYPHWLLSEEPEWSMSSVQEPVNPKLWKLGPLRQHGLPVACSLEGRPWWSIAPFWPFHLRCLVDSKHLNYLKLLLLPFYRYRSSVPSDSVWFGEDPLYQSQDWNLHFYIWILCSVMNITQLLFNSICRMHFFLW